MIAVDTNVLVYAHREDMEQHRAARDRLAALAAAGEPWGVPALVLVEFLRVVTHPRIFPTPTPVQRATAAVDRLLENPTLRLLHPGQRFWPLLREAVDEGGARGNLVLDAAIVALCREHGVRTILSADRDFRRFPSITLQQL